MPEKIRRVIRVAVPFAVMPAAVIAGGLFSGERLYAWMILLMVILTQLLFMAGFERRTVGTRRLVIAAVMTALSVLGRFVFAPLPGFKPITAIVVITAVWIGGETGFLVGALSALISNFFSGQGPWTPFQMFAWGMIGLIAGYLASPLRRSRVLLALYGILAGIAYSFFMDIWTVLWYNGTFAPALWVSAIAAAVPHTVMYSVSNCLFLWFLAKPIGEKLERVRVKYGV